MPVSPFQYVRRNNKIYVNLVKPSQTIIDRSLIRKRNSNIGNALLDIAQGNDMKALQAYFKLGS